MTVSESMSVSMSMSMCMCMHMCMWMSKSRTIDSCLVLQLLDLQPVVTLGLLVTMTAIDATGTEQ